MTSIKTGRIIVAGGVNLDTTYHVDALPAVGETIFSKTQSEALGGKGLNQAVAARRAGAEVSIFGTTGVDSAGLAVREFLSDEGVATDFLAEYADLPTGRAMLTVDASANNTIVVAPGANLAADQPFPQGIDKHLAETAMVLANAEALCDAVETLFTKARQHGVLTVWNPSPMPEHPEVILAKTDILVVNQAEAKDLVGEQDGCIATARALCNLGQQETVLTLGKDGCVVATENEIFQVPAVLVEAVDPTAAGDTFLGYYLATRLNGAGRKLAAATATVAASVCVQVRGAAVAVPRLAELERSAIDQIYAQASSINCASTI